MRIEGHTDGDLTAIITMLLVLAMPGLWVALAKPLKVGVGHIVEDDAAFESEQSRLRGAQARLDLLALFQQLELLASNRL